MNNPEWVEKGMGDPDNLEGSRARMRASQYKKPTMDLVCPREKQCNTLRVDPK